MGSTLSRLSVSILSRAFPDNGAARRAQQWPATIAPDSDAAHIRFRNFHAPLGRRCGVSNFNAIRAPLGSSDVNLSPSPYRSLIVHGGGARIDKTRRLCTHESRGPSQKKVIGRVQYFSRAIAPASEFRLRRVPISRPDCMLAGIRPRESGSRARAHRCPRPITPRAAMCFVRLRAD